MFKNKKILITGATGFIGANLVRYFISKGEDVSIFTRKTSNKWRIKNVLKNVTEYEVDLANIDRLDEILSKIKPDIIFHTAIYGGYPFQTNTKKIFETIFWGTINLVSACKKIDFELFVNTGSSSEYGIKNQPMKENDILEPVTDYGIAKSAATLYCQKVVKVEGYPIVTLRLFSPYGYYEDTARLIPAVIIASLQQKNPNVTSPDSVRDFIFIEDVIDAYIKAVENKDKIGSEVFNIGYGKQYTVGEVVNKIIKLTGDKVKPQWGSVSNPRTEPTMWQADISKAKKILNWQPKYNLTQGLEKTINWFRENMNLYNNSL